MEPTSVRRNPVGPWVVALLSGSAHVVVGYFYVVSGLAIPLYALLPLWIVWSALALWIFRLALERSWWTPVVPVIAAGVLLLSALTGAALFGWTA